MTPETLSKLDTMARLLIVLGILMILIGQSAGIVPIVIGVPWIVAGLMGWGRVKIEPYRGPKPKPKAAAEAPGAAPVAPPDDLS